jgi:hypothetical protein
MPSLILERANAFPKEPRQPLARPARPGASVHVRPRSPAQVTMSGQKAAGREPNQLAQMLRHPARRHE